MTITLHWWMLPILLFVVPVIILLCAESDHSAFFGDTPSCLWTIVTIICWGIAIGVIIGHYV